METEKYIAKEFAMYKDEAISLKVYMYDISNLFN